MIKVREGGRAQFMWDLVGHVKEYDFILSVMGSN